MAGPDRARQKVCVNGEQPSDERRPNVGFGNYDWWDSVVSRRPAMTCKLELSCSHIIPRIFASRHRSHSTIRPSVSTTVCI